MPNHLHTMTRPESNNVRWQPGNADNSLWFGEPCGWLGIVSFVMQDHSGQTAITVTGPLATVATLATIPFSDRFRNRALRFAEGRRMVEQFWGTVILDISTLAPQYRHDPVAIAASIRTQAKTFAAQVSMKSLLVSRQWHGSAPKR